MKLVSHFFLFVFFVSAFLFVQRTFTQQHSKRVVATHMLAKIGTLHVVLMILLTLTTKLVVAMVCIFTLQLLSLALTPMVARFREQYFKESILKFLDDVVLGMKTGASFRSAFEDAKTKCDAFTQQKLTEIMGHVAFSQQTSSIAVSRFACLLVEEFMHVDQQPHRAIQRLELFRTRLKLEQSFRRRSGDATRQVRAQMIVLGVMYVGILVVVSLQVRLWDYSALLATSLSLMGLGYLVIWRFVRGFQCRV